MGLVMVGYGRWYQSCSICMTLLGFFGSSSYSSHLQRPRLQPLGLWVSDWFRLSIHGCVLDQGPLQDSQATGIQPCPGLFFARTIMKASWVLSLQNASRLWSSELKSWSLHWLSTSWGSMTSNWSAKRVSVKFSLAWWKHLGWDHSVLNTQWYYAEDMDQKLSKQVKTHDEWHHFMNIHWHPVTSCYFMLPLTSAILMLPGPGAQVTARVLTQSSKATRLNETARFDALDSDLKKLSLASNLPRSY